MTRRREQYRLGAVLLLLLVLHFALRPFLGDFRSTPDFILLALLVFAIRARPGQAAVAGFLVGLLVDSLTPVAFGAAALAHTCVGYLAAWGKAVFFAENLLVNAGFFFGGTWLRDLLVMVAGRHMEDSVFWWQLVFWSPLKAITTAVVGVLVLLVFRRWLQIRISK
ncbi:MAG: rod shape-determining protein MreD [Gemmatimonadales bacterium]|nr:rod shape-determining protein MreD [Gemmatimonadales bacterium]NIN11669.1 rod shape-determining protein MreD [Gemmatimonadales bacterium]NIN50275.1 rod shape-determining protein MreD [Gemmatimonadales bacterium]NIP07739.1 rod shape-determining protein MreD [Gemmatimonadales bacterium]NIQ99142.1 rod shape-determining protein MreD [Gemmatimonadales bacterium]